MVLSSRSQESVDAAVAALGDQVVGVAADNADPATPERLVAAARKRWGRLDGASASVGGPPLGGVTEDHGRAVARGVRRGVPGGRPAGPGARR